MLKIENVDVMGFEAAIRGMRNPLNSWDKSDSSFEDVFEDPENLHTYYMKNAEIGPNDFDLMKRLRNAGTDHRKFMRMIAVYVDITAPLYWWKEFDTYKVGTVANSCSTMHKIADKEFTIEDFSWEHLLNIGCDLFQVEYDNGLFKSMVQPLFLLKDFIIPCLNVCREKYLDAKVKPMKEEAKRTEIVKTYWWQMIQLLPSSYNQRRTVMLNYEVLANMYKSRKNHKLDEWHVLCDWVKTLPYSQLITGEFDVPEEK